MLRAIEQLRRRPDLHGAAIVHHHDLIGKSQRFDLIVRDIDHQQVEGAVHALQFRAQLPLQRGIDHGQRLVEQHRRDVRTHQAAAERDLLLGVGRQPARAPAEVGGQIEHVGDLGDAFVDDRLRQPSVLQRKRKVLRDRHRVVDHRKLKHLRDISLLGRQMRDVPVVEQQTTLGGDDEAGDDVEQRRLAAAGRAEQRIGHALLPDVLQRLQLIVGLRSRLAAIGVGDAVERDGGHVTTSATKAAPDALASGIESEYAPGIDVDIDGLAGRPIVHAGDEADPDADADIDMDETLRAAEFGDRDRALKFSVPAVADPIVAASARNASR